MRTAIWRCRSSTMSMTARTALAADYDAVRPPFAETGTPRLPIGLNLGAQLFWQARLSRTRSRAPAHPDVPAILGVPADRRPRQRGDLARLPHRSVGLPQARFLVRWSTDGLARADGAGSPRGRSCLGPSCPRSLQRPAWPRDTPVLCGIHDFNASLLPHLLGRQQPFSVVSTGTWVICHGDRRARVELDPARDTLVNVNAFGEPVPSARFMGGREFETLVGKDGRRSRLPPISRRCWTSRSCSTPSVQQGSGPFPTRQSEWIGGEPQAAHAPRRRRSTWR